MCIRTAGAVGWQHGWLQDDPVVGGKGVVFLDQLFLAEKRLLMAIQGKSCPKLNPPWEACQDPAEMARGGNGTESNVCLAKGPLVSVVWGLGAPCSCCNQGLAEGRTKMTKRRGKRAYWEGLQVFSFHQTRRGRLNMLTFFKNTRDFHKKSFGKVF